MAEDDLDFSGKYKTLPKAPAPAPAPAATPAAPATAQPIDRALPRPDTIALSAPLPGFMKGINLGNCFDAPSEGEWGTTISEKHFQMAKAAGMDRDLFVVADTGDENGSNTG